MKRNLLFIVLMSCSTFLLAQPELDSWIMTTGYAKYTTGGPTITMADSGDVQRVCYNTTDVYIQATGLAGTYTMGPWVGNPNIPSGQNYTFRLPRNPQQQTGPKTTVPLFGSVGVAVNGVVFFGYGDARSYKASTGTNEPNGDGNWYSDAWVSEGSTMDGNGNGHPQQQGAYHYHANPIQLYSTAGTSHSPIIGFAYDGYPVYGPFGYANAMDSTSGISRMVPGYTLRSITDRSTLPGGSPSVPAGPSLSAYALGTYIQDYEFTGTGDLDEYNGRWCVTPEYPGPVGTYAYFMSTDSNGDPKFPYLFAAEYYGQVTTTGTNNTIPGNVTCGMVTNVPQLQQHEEVNIYPNPASDQITIEYGNQLPNQVIVMNALGEVVYSDQPAQTVNVSRLPAGIYQLILQYDNQLVNHKFVKH
ncbi:MAG: YHYH protein [Flavobacteriales bacterium]|nr:YHYH protein [Flavobacteriales bacterium]